MSDIVDNEDELFASGIRHDTDQLDHAIKKIHRCEHSGKTLKMYCQC